MIIGFAIPLWIIIGQYSMDLSVPNLPTVTSGCALYNPNTSSLFRNVTYPNNRYASTENRANLGLGVLDGSNYSTPSFPSTTLKPGPMERYSVNIAAV